MKNTASSQVLLTDQYRSSPLKLVESYATPDGPYTNAVIATLYGVLSDYGNETRNDRWYTGSLWKKVLNSELFKEMIETKTLFGEPDHPMDVENRLEVHIPYVSHIIREPHINEANQTVEGYLDILDTPYGRIIKTLIDYGCILGVSSRGSGDLTSDGGRTIVDEDSYNFITWDIVARPSNKKARVDEIDTISLDPKSTGKTAFESMESQIRSMIKGHDKGSLQLTESLISTTDIPDKEKLIGLIKESYDSEFASRQSNANDGNSDPTDSDDPVVPKSDLDEAYGRVLSLKKENTELGIENKDLRKSLEDAQNTISELSGLNENLRSMVSSYMDKLSESHRASRTTVITDKMNESTTDGKNPNDEDNDLEPQMLEVIDPDYTEITEAIRKSSTVLLNRIDEMQKELDKSSDLSKEVDRLNKEVDGLSEEVDDLTKKLDNSQNENIRMIRRYSNAVSEYFRLRCSMLGINEQIARNEFRNRLSEYDVKDIDDVLTEMYSSSRSMSSRVNESITSPQAGNAGKVGSLTLSGSRISQRPGKLMQESIDDASGQSSGDTTADVDISALASIVGQVRNLK